MQDPHDINFVDHGWRQTHGTTQVGMRVTVEVRGSTMNTSASTRTGSFAVQVYCKDSPVQKLDLTMTGKTSVAIQDASGRHGTTPPPAHVPENGIASFAVEESAGVVGGQLTATFANGETVVAAITASAADGIVATQPVPLETARAAAARGALGTALN